MHTQARWNKLSGSGRALITRIVAERLRSPLGLSKRETARLERRKGARK
jgi:hypothetical protein